MTAPVIERSPLTDLVKTTLATLTGKAVGDGRIPISGWLGQPGAPGSTFRPYVVLSEIVASHSSGSLTEAQTDWQLPYQVESFGITRDQAEKMAELARRALGSLQTTPNTLVNLAGAAYNIAWVRYDAIGQPNPVDALDPPIYSVQDGITFWLMKEI